MGLAQGDYKGDEYSKNRKPNRDGKDQGRENAFLEFEDMYEVIREDDMRYRGGGTLQFH